MSRDFLLSGRTFYEAQHILFPQSRRADLRLSSSPYQARENVPSYEFTVDLQQDTAFSAVLLNFIKQGEVGVNFPEKVSYYASSNGVDYTLLGEITAPRTDRTAYADHYLLKLAEPFTARYVKAVVTTGTGRITACDEFEVIGAA